MAQLGANYPLGPDRAGYYSTAPLKETLLDLVDFSRVNQCSRRLTVGAAHVRTSQMRYFDSRDAELGVEHVMASGALPPAFPPVRIENELYWDGGILSNTPTEAVFDDNLRKNSVIFAVHMWNPTGTEPETMADVFNRQKDIQYSSRIATHISRQQQTHRLRRNSLRSCPTTNVGMKRYGNWLFTAAQPACTWCDCLLQCWNARTTRRISISAPQAFVSVGRPVHPHEKRA